jgi:hypothetical protein
MFWWGVLTEFAICLALVVLGTLVLYYIFPEDLTRSQLGFIRKKQPRIRKLVIPFGANGRSLTTAGRIGYFKSHI